MLDPRDWFGGHDDEDDDPVAKTLRYLGLEGAGNAIGQGASAVGQAVQDVGSGIGSAVSPYLPQPSATPAPEDYSFAPPDNPLATGLAAAGKAGVEAYEETASPLSPWSAPALAPARAAYIAERALPEIGGEIGAAAGRAAAGPDAAPYLTVPESVPVVGGQDVGAEQVGRFIGGGLTDPLTYVGAAGAAAAGAPARKVAAELARGLPGVGEAELLGRGAVGAVRGLGSRAGEALGLAGNAERVAAADARMAAEGSTLAPGTFGALAGGPNLEARIAAAEARLEHAATRLEAADATLAQAADAGSAAELRAARGGYSPARSAYDEAAARVEQLREQRRMLSRDIEGAGYGRPVEDAGIDTSAVEREATSAYGGQPEAVPPFRDDAPRSISLNAGFGVVPDAPRPRRASAQLPPQADEMSALGRRVMDTYRGVTPSRVERSTERATRIAADQIAARRPPRGGLATPPDELVRATHEAIVRNLRDAKTVMTGIRPGAIAAYLRGEGLTSKVDTRDLDAINKITQAQVNVAGGRAGRPYTLEDAADFAQRESEQMRVATGGTRFPDPETGAIDEAAPRVMYGYVSEGQPLVGPNRPTSWLVWEDDTPRITSAHHPYGLTSPDQDIHAAMPKGLKEAIWSEDAVKGGRIAPAVMEGGRLVEAAAGVAEGVSPARFGWEQGGIDVGGGRRIADTNWLVGPEGEDAMRANGLLLGMPGVMQRAIARGDLADPEDIAAALMRGGSPKWKSGWAAVMNPSRSESLIVDPSIANVKAIYLTGSEKDLARKVPNTGGMTELQVAERLRDDIKARYDKDVPILFTDISKANAPTAIADARLMAGPPTRLAEGRRAIVDRYTGATNPATGEPYVDIGVSAGTLPPAGPTDRLAGVNRVLGQGIASSVSGGVGAQVNQEMNPDDPLAGIKGFAAGALVPPLAARGGMALARRAGAVGERAGGRAFSTLGALPDPDEIADLARRAAETPITRPRAEGEQVTRNVARNVAKQAERGVPPDVPTAAMPPPDAPPGWFDKYNAYRYSIGMFSNISTGLVQLLGGAVDASLGIPTEAIRTGIIKGRPELLPAMARESISAVPAMARAAGRTARGDIPEQILKGSEYRPPLSKQYEQRGEATKAAVAHAVEAPGRVMTQSPDAFWNEGFYKAGLAQAAADEAAKEVGRTDPLGAIRRQNELIENPTPEVEARARQLAEDATYKGDLGLLASLLELPFKYPESLPGGKSGAAGFARGVGSHLLPVYRTIARIHERALEVTPGVGMLPLNRMGLAAPERTRPLDQKLAQQAVGLGVATAVWSYAANGGIRGPGPTNTNQRQAMTDRGYVPNTFNVGGYWVPISWLGMYGPLVQGIASVNDAVLYDEGGKQFGDLSAEDKLNRMVQGIGRGFRDYPFADASKTIMQLGQDPGASFAGLVGETASQLVPGPLKTVFAAGDPTGLLVAPDPWTRRPDRGEDIGALQRGVDTFKLRSGLGRQSLPIAQDILGRPVPNRRQGIAAFLPRVGEDRPDPVIQAYLDNDVNIGDPPKKLSLEGMKDPENAPALSSAEQRRWNEIRGELVVGSVQGMLDNGTLAGAAPAARTRKLEEIRDHAAVAAHRRLRVEMGAEVQRRLDENRARKAQRAS